MKTRKMTPLMIFHLVLMILFCIGSIVIVVGLTLYAHALTGEDTAWKSSVYSFGTMSIFNALAMVAGILYLCNGYSKQAAPIYKAFLVITALSVVASFFVNLFGMKGNAAEPTDPAIGSNALIITRMGLQCVKLIILLMLAFAKDLGKQKSWILLWVMIALDIILPLLNLSTLSLKTILVSILVTFFTRLLMDGTIGLALKGKYDDKDTRGTT